MNSTELKKQVFNKIKEDYGSISNFVTTTDLGKELGNNLKSYLSATGSVSYPAMKKLCNHLKIGKLKKKVKVIREVTYTID